MIVSETELAVLRAKLAEGVAAEEAIMDSVGGCETSGGLWRFFSRRWPAGGVRQWNEAAWCSLWKPFLPDGFYSFGEDIFGNQLILLPKEPEVFLWNHENSEYSRLFVGPVELLETVIQNGIGWIDFYSGDSLSIARQYGRVPMEYHLHWITPLFLSGQIHLENLAVVERENHLIGHAKLWSQVSELENGSALF